MEVNLMNQISNGGNYIIQISANDLREVVKSMYEDERIRTAQAIEQSREHATLTRKEAARLLGVTLSTLWKWGQEGYLVPVKIGSRVMYRPSDIDGLLRKSQA